MERKFMGFIGVFRNYVLDSKGRVSLPAEFREQLEALNEKTLVIMRGFGSYLILMPHSRWIGEMRDLSSRILSDPDRSRDLIDTWRYLSLGAFKKEMDKYGRIMVPKELRKHAFIEKKVSFVGLTDYIEIWDSETLIKHEVALESKVGGSGDVPTSTDLEKGLLEGNIIYANLMLKR